MDRLTIPEIDYSQIGVVENMRTAPLAAMLCRLAAYEDTGLSPEECAEYAKADKEGRYIVLKDRERQGVDRLREIAKADVEGRLVVLPSIKVFVLQYVGGEDCDNICPARVNGVGFCSVCDKSEIGVCEAFCEQRHLEYIGKTVFLTREEAEKALEAKNG